MILSAPFWWLAVGLMGQTSGEAPTTDQAVRHSCPDVRCGSYALFVTLKATGFDVGSFEDLEKSLGPPGQEGYSLLQLKEQAVKSGADAIAVDSNLENLRARKRPFGCVALLKEDHFVVLYDADETTAYLVDDFRSSRLPIETFRYLWTGKALIVGPGPLEAEESIRPGRGRWLAILAASGLIALLGLLLIWRRSRVAGASRRAGSIVPALIAIPAASWALGCGTGQAPVPAITPVKPATIRVEPASHDLGSVPITRVGETIEVPTTVRNVGQDTLEIREVRTSCTCTVSELSNSRISPGGQVILKSTIKLGDSADARRSDLTIHSSDPNRPAVVVAYQWRVVNPISVSQGSCRFPRLAPGAGDARTIALEAKGLILCDRCKLSALVDSSLIKIDATLVDGPRSSGHGSDRSGPKPFALGTIRVEVLGSEESRDYRQTLSAIVRCGDEVRGKLDIPVTWSVGAGISVTPARVSFGMAKAGGLVVGRVVARSVERKPFKILRLDSETPGLIQDVRFAEESRDIHVIEFGVKMPAEIGPWTTKIRIEADDRDAPSITLPMSAMIVGAAPASSEGAQP